MLLVGRRTTFECLKQEGCDVLGSLKPEQWHQARAIVCQSILHTDMIKHDEMMSMLGNKKEFEPDSDKDRAQMCHAVLHAMDLSNVRCRLHTSRCSLSLYIISFCTRTPNAHV